MALQRVVDNVDFFVSDQPFDSERDGFYVGRWVGPKIDNQGLINLRLGNPYKVEGRDRAAATLKLVDSYLDGTAAGRSWLNHCFDVARAAKQLGQRKLVCHCKGDIGCHAQLIARLFNAEPTASDWIVNLRQHRAILVGDEQDSLF